jgi:predicted nucleotidyltransferase component of viral defense system
MNKNKLRSSIQKIEKKTGLNYNAILILYFLEAILKRIAVSPYKDYFIFKGGFLLSSILGIENRTTMDMDMLFVNQELTEENIINILTEIIKIDLKDDLILSVESTETIKEDDDYGGFRIKIKCMLDNIRQIIPLDIATGDPVTPGAKLYDYHTLTENKSISIKTYNLETIIAEKIHTIFVRGEFNSRNKDFFDIYILNKLKRDQIDVKVLKEAFKNTFRYRQTDLRIEAIKKKSDFNI